MMDREKKGDNLSGNGDNVVRIVVSNDNELELPTIVLITLVKT